MIGGLQGSFTSENECHSFVYLSLDRLGEGNTWKDIEADKAHHSILYSTASRLQTNSSSGHRGVDHP